LGPSVRFAAEEQIKRMNIDFWSAPGRFWRGNLHTHSTRSDGHLPPEQVCARYREAGYDFLALTDHFQERYGFPITDTAPYRTSEFTTLLGAELHTGRTEFGHLWHILAVGLPADFAPYPAGETGPQVAARALESGAYVAAAHPAWYGLSEQDILSLGPIHAVEIYNGTSEDQNDRADSGPLYDLLLMRGARLNACATDDAHFTTDRHDLARGWVYVKSETLHPEPLIAALKAGRYFSSTGPQIHQIQITSGNRLIVRCSPAKRIWLTGYGSASEFVHGHGITQAEFDLRALKASPFFRVTVADRQGGRAWSNPIWL
jgi:hypothetical protein